MTTATKIYLDSEHIPSTIETLEVNKYKSYGGVGVTCTSERYANAANPQRLPGSMR